MFYEKTVTSRENFGVTLLGLPFLLSKPMWRVLDDPGIGLRRSVFVNSAKGSIYLLKKVQSYLIR